MGSRARRISGIGLAALLLFSLASAPADARRKQPPRPRMPPAVLQIPETALEPVGFDALEGWAADDHRRAFQTFLASCRPILRRDDPAKPPRLMYGALRGVCARAVALPAPASEEAAKAFFEKEFRPVRITPLESQTGFLTGYYEPEIAGSLTWSPEYDTPVYGRPDDLINKGAGTGAASNKGPAFLQEGADLLPYYDRGEIQDGALAGKGLEIVWLKDPVEAFFSHIQGSIRVRLPDGNVMRLNYAGHNGYPYTPVGRILVERNIVPREEMSMDRIRRYITENPEAGRDLMRQNRSYVFFREVKELAASDGAMGAQGIPLTDGRSIAVDRHIHVYGTPFYIEATLPLERVGSTDAFRRLMIAQDTGSAIVGPSRADIFFGAGPEMGMVAGRIRHPGRFTMLVPRDIDPGRLGAFVPSPRPRPALDAAPKPEVQPKPKSKAKPRAKQRPKT